MQEFETREMEMTEEAEESKETLESSAEAQETLGIESEETLEALQIEESESDSGKQFLEDDQVKSIVESLLFASDKPVSLGTMVQLFKGTNITTKDLKRVMADYQSQLAGPSRGVCLEEVVGGYQLRTKMDNAEFLKRLSKTRPFRLSGPALEVLSIVAYKQPLIKAEIDEIRGVESGHLVRALMEKGIVQFAGKSELPGRPMLYATTRKFLEIFGLRNLQELPTLSEIDELLPEGIGQEEDEEVITLGELAASMTEQTKDSYSEGEEDLIKITEKIQSINTSSDFFEQEKERMRAQRDLERARDLREALEVGEDVDEKDLKWLARYELVQQAKQDAALAAEAQQTPPSEESEEATGEEVISLEELSLAPLGDSEPLVSPDEPDEATAQELLMATSDDSVGNPEDVTDEELEEFLFSDSEESES